jgi:hypothetical protein
MGEDYGIDRGGIEEEMTVPVVRLGAVSLVEAAIEEDAGAVDVDEMLGPRGRLGRAAKGDLHGGVVAGGAVRVNSAESTSPEIPERIHPRPWIGKRLSDSLRETGITVTTENKL